MGNEKCGKEKYLYFLNPQIKISIIIPIKMFCRKFARRLRPQRSCAQSAHNPHPCQIPYLSHIKNMFDSNVNKFI